MNVKYDDNGLVVAIAQDVDTNEVLMQAFMNKEAYEKTLSTGIAHYYSRSRKCLWKKGETSGNIQEVCGVFLDCDGDSILLKVRQTGVACHTGERSCFFNAVQNCDVVNSAVLYNLYNTIKDRKDNPKEGSYTNYLFEKGIDKILKKVGEENAEVIIASKNEGIEELKYETADLIYHLLVLLNQKEMPLNDLFCELKSREK